MTKIIRILALVVAITSAGSLAAQTSINGGISALGIKSGDQDTKTYLGFYAGLTQNMKLSDHTGFAFSIYYNQFSGDVKTTVLGANHHSEYFENNINPSLAFNYRFILTEKSCIYLFLGPEANVVLSAKRDNWVDGIDLHNKTDLLNQDEAGNALLRRFNLSGIGGIGAKIDFLNITLGAAIPYENNASGEKIARVFLGVGLVF